MTRVVHCTYDGGVFAIRYIRSRPARGRRWLTRREVVHACVAAMGGPDRASEQIGVSRRHLNRMLSNPSPGMVIRVLEAADAGVIVELPRA